MLLTFDMVVAATNTIINVVVAYTIVIVIISIMVVTITIFIVTTVTSALSLSPSGSCTYILGSKAKMLKRPFFYKDFKET